MQGCQHNCKVILTAKYNSCEILSRIYRPKSEVQVHIGSPTIRRCCEASSDQGSTLKNAS